MTIHVESCSYAGATKYVPAQTKEISQKLLVTTMHNLAQDHTNPSFTHLLLDENLAEK